MIHLRKPSDDDDDDDDDESRDSSSPSFELSKGNPFGEGFPELNNVKETSDSVRAFPMSNKSSHVSRAERRRSSVERNRMEAPSTPGRPVFNFSVGRKNIPSKWDDAEKWLISSSSSFHESPAHVTKIARQKGDAFGESKLRVSEEEKKVSSFHMEFHGATSEVFLKDKFTENVEPHFLRCHRTGEVEAVRRRDVGTAITPLGSSTAPRRHTPIKNSSPPRHNTPAGRSGPLVNFNNAIDISALDLRAHRFDLVAANWSSREEEEEVSKSLRHFEARGKMKSIGESRAATWADGERTKSCIRYRREEERIQAWVSLQKAKAEARSRKLEVKIHKMRSDLEEKLTKRMASVHRRAEEWRASAQLLHSQQVLRAASEEAQKMEIQHSIDDFKDHSSCGCLPPLNSNSNSNSKHKENNPKGF